MQKDYILITLADDDEDDRLFFTDAFDELKINTVVNTFKNGKAMSSVDTTFSSPLIEPASSSIVSSATLVVAFATSVFVFVFVVIIISF